MCATLTSLAVFTKGCLWKAHSGFLVNIIIIQLPFIHSHSLAVRNVLHKLSHVDTGYRLNLVILKV